MLAPETPMCTVNFNNPLTVEAGKKYAVIVRTPYHESTLPSGDFWMMYLSDQLYSGGEGLRAENRDSASWLPTVIEGSPRDFYFAIYLNGSTTPVDDTPPQLSLPADITKEATGPSGATVSYNATATDDKDASVTADCSPASGNTFPLGTAPVNYSATDAAGNKATGSFNVTVQDTTPLR